MYVTEMGLPDKVKLSMKYGLIKTRVAVAVASITLMVTLLFRIMRGACLKCLLRLEAGQIVTLRHPESNSLNSTSC